MTLPMGCRINMVRAGLCEEDGEDHWETTTADVGSLDIRSGCLTREDTIRTSPRPSYQVRSRLAKCRSQKYMTKWLLLVGMVLSVMSI